MGGKTVTKSNNNLPTIESLSAADRETITAGLRRGATRREVMGWLVASGATIAVAGSIVSSARKVMAATPKQGGRLSYATDLHGPSGIKGPVVKLKAAIGP